MSAGDNEAGQKSISNQLMQNPDLLAALQVKYNKKFELKNSESLFCQLFF